MIAPRARLVLAALILLACSSARAAPPELPRGQWKTLTVAVLPVRYLGGLDDPFTERPEVPRLRAEAARWHRGLELAFQGRDQVVLLGATELRERLQRLTDVRRAGELAQERYALGLERWRALQAREALTHLDRARELLIETHADLSDPRALADVELHRGLALMDLGEVGPARIAFTSMFVLDPSRRFERGYYGATIEQELAGAARDVAAIPTPSAIIWPAERLSALATRLGLDVVALGLVTEGPARLDVALFDARTNGLSLSESFALSDTSNLTEDLDRAVSAWHTCALEAPRSFVRPAPRRRWFLDLGYTHAVWLNHRRTRDYLHGPGAHIGVTFVPTPGLELWVKTSQRVTMTDANQDLLDAFTVTHLALGAGLGVGDQRVSFALRAGVEVALSLADIAMTTDVDCKFFGGDSDRCRGIFRAESPAVWLGLDFSASLRVSPVRSWYLSVSAGTTIYALSGSLVGELNFPLYGTFGFGLPF